MAVNLLSQEVSDLCIGKPAVRTLSTAATVGEAISALKSWEDSNVRGLLVLDAKRKIVGSICTVDVLCFLCAKENISSSSAAAVLAMPISLLISNGSALARRIEPDSSIWEALDAMLDDGKTQSLVVPIGGGSLRKKTELVCWLTQEDLVRFFFNSIYHFSPLASLSVASLGLVRPAVLTVRHCEPAVSALPLVRAALAERTSVAVVTNDGRLVGEISPSTLSACDETVAAAVACLSAGEMMAYVDCCTESVVEAVKARLRERGMEAMVQLLSSSCNSDDVAAAEVGNGKRRKPRRTRSGSYSARMGWRAEEAIVCHPESSLVAVMVQALAHRVSYVWVVRDDDYGLVGVVTFRDVLALLREQLLQDMTRES